MKRGRNRNSDYKNSPVSQGAEQLPTIKEMPANGQEAAEKQHAVELADCFKSNWSVAWPGGLDVWVGGV